MIGAKHAQSISSLLMFLLKVMKNKVALRQRLQVVCESFFFEKFGPCCAKRKTPYYCETRFVRTQLSTYTRL